jgi:hypothetical protein
LYEARSTVGSEFQSPPAMLPLNVRVPDEKMDFSTRNAAAPSAWFPSPSLEAPATKATRALSTPSPSSDFETTTSGPLLTTRKTGRLAVERSVHFQSSSSWLVRTRTGRVAMASNRVLSVRLTISFDPGCRTTFSRKAGRKETAVALIS